MKRLSTIPSSVTLDIKKLKTKTLSPLPLTPQQRKYIDDVLSAGVTFNEFGLVVPKWSREVRSKISASLLETRHSILQAIQQGKHVVYVPGSYDLLHVGHASYIHQGIEEYQERHSISRDKLFVVALCDDDQLVQAVKPAHLYASSGEHPRPIEGAELFRRVVAQYAHPRAIDMASLPFVDLVGLIPSPAFFDEIRSNPVVSQWLEGVNVLELPQEEVLEKILCRVPSERREAFIRETVGTINRFNTLLVDLQCDNFCPVSMSFERAKFNLGYDISTARWDVGSWQLLMHRFLGDVYAPGSVDRYTRIISEHDQKYKDSVALLMKLSGIGALFFEDVNIVSTSQLVSHFGWQVLVESKIVQFEELLP
jgi:hypothetical protein